MKSLMKLWQVVAEELATWCDTSTAHDVTTACVRAKNEGLSFFMITLPAFGSDFEKSLDQGAVGSDLFPGFSRKGGLPKFLSGFLCQVFDARSGVLMEDPNTDAIFAVRQLTLMYKKIEQECSEKRTLAALDAFISCEDSLKSVDMRLDSLNIKEFRRISAILFGDVFDAVNREVDCFEISPGHGPGKTADRLSGNQKFVQSEWTERLEPYFPYGEYVLPSWRHYGSSMPRFLTPSEERPVRVTFVPKTLKTPRVIAIEPTCMQYMQQGLLRSFVPKLESMTNSRHFVGFTDQSLNRDMARMGSITGELATLDLSEASDRVLNSLVLEMLKAWPSLSGAVQACRSRSATLPDGRKVRLAKFASMGSALCFPMEAMVFTTIVFMGIQAAHNTSLTTSKLSSYRGKVRVYGDDIVIPVDCVSSVIGHLEAFGLKVNHSKSFWTGKFRESCGGDYFEGEEVTPLRLSKHVPSSRQQVREITSFAEFSNALFKRGLWKSASWAQKHLEGIIGPLPCVPWDSQAIGVHSFNGVKPHGWDADLQRHTVFAYLRTDEIPVSNLDDIWALRKSFSGDWSDPSSEGHLERAGRPLSVSIKKGWVLI